MSDISPPPGAPFLTAQWRDVIGVTFPCSQDLLVPYLPPGATIDMLDGSPRVSLVAFEFSESLPLSLGVIIDGSGSMQSSMSLVHQAASEFVQKLVGEKDQGFVMEFREAPVLLASMTKNQSDLVRAVAETRAAGGTALYDSIVMGLYQFRAVPGKKAPLPSV